MIGDEQIKGYPEETKEMKKLFEESQKKVKESIGIKEPEEPSKEEMQKMAMNAMGNKKGNIEHKITNMEQDLMILRKQVNEMVTVLNKLQIGFISKLSEMQGRIDSKLNDIKQGVDKNS